MHAGNRAANTEEATSEFEQSRIPLNEGKGGTKTKERQRGEARRAYSKGKYLDWGASSRC